jgi:hypothetical protein
VLGDTLSCAGSGWGDPIQTDGQKLWYSILYNLLTVYTVKRKGRGCIVEKRGKLQKRQIEGIIIVRGGINAFVEKDYQEMRVYCKNQSDRVEKRSRRERDVERKRDKRTCERQKTRMEKDSKTM